MLLQNVSLEINSLRNPFKMVVQLLDVTFQGTSPENP